MINLQKTSVQHATLVQDLEKSFTQKAYSKNDLKKGITINCKHSKTEFKQAEERERINYIRQFGMGDKRNWG